MSPEDFRFLADILYQRSGLSLSDGKVYLMESRLMPLVRRRSMSDLSDLIIQVRTGKDEELLVEITEAMTTNESYFFRDAIPFDQFRDVSLPALLSNEGKSMSRIWCAAASTGQEPYSLAMILKEAAVKVGHHRIEILATDLSVEVLEKAKVGLYSQFEVQRGLPIQMLMKYFEQKGSMWQLDPAIRAMINYRKFNLLDDISRLGRFDVIFCRNVLIYFDQPTKSKVLDRMAKMLHTGGTLYLGAAETVIGITEKFRPVKGMRGLYELSGASPTRSVAAGAVAAGAVAAGA